MEEHFLWEEVRCPIVGHGQTQKERAPERRSHHSTVLFSEKMYVFGGEGRVGNKMSDLWVYKMEDDHWDAQRTERRRGDDKLVPRSHHSAFIHGDSMVVFGGQAEDQRPLGDLWSLELNDHVWSRLTVAAPPDPRHSHTAVAFENTAVIFGGASGTRALDDTCILVMAATPTWSYVTGPGPQARYSHAAVPCAGDQMLIFGGVSDDQGKLNDLWELQVSKQRWTRVETVGVSPSPRSGHALGVHGAVIVLFGGTLESNCTESNELFYFNRKSATWKLKHGQLEVSLGSQRWGDQGSETVDEAEEAKPSEEAARRRRLRAVTRPQHCVDGMSQFGVVFAAQVFGCGAELGLTHGVGLGVQAAMTTRALERIEGTAPCGRGGHSAIVHDGVLFVFGGDRGRRKLNDTFTLKV
mmetsp:Transcript_92291/g.246819  ORF Transcript_92291/g.246819 Transcript_92291/m.246819 type:complete len:410 (-) Transcript_92291:2-1231(-)